MGYTHYWTQPRVLTAGEMGQIAHVLQAIIGVADCAIAGWDGTGEPTISFDTIAFNGKDDDSHETFAIDADQPGSGFCKTAYKPYDVVVTALLTYLAAEHGFEISSDGNAEDWEAGNKLLTMATGKALPNPLKEEVADA